MEKKIKYFLEEPNKGWLSRDWFLRVFESMGTDNTNQYTLNPLEAIQTDNYSDATDIHTLFRHYGFYSNNTLDITEHEFVPESPTQQ